MTTIDIKTCLFYNNNIYTEPNLLVNAKPHLPEGGVPFTFLTFHNKFSITIKKINYIKIINT